MRAVVAGAQEDDDGALGVAAARGATEETECEPWEPREWPRRPSQTSARVSSSSGSRARRLIIRPLQAAECLRAGAQ